MIFSAPNRTFFRFLTHAGFRFEESAVLEVGFSHGADLLECDRRRAITLGVDIDTEPVHTFASAGICQLDASKDSLPYKNLDLIYALDVIYYWDDAGIEHFLRECYRCLKPTGLVCVSIIENDWRASEDTFRTLYSEDMYVIFRKAGFNLVGYKRVTETFYVYAEHTREWCYLLYQMPGVLV